MIGNGWRPTSYGGGTLDTFENTGMSYTVGQAVQIVVELTTTNDGASNDTWKMWVDPGSGDLASPDAQRTDWTIDDITRITHRAGNGSASTTMSNIVIADSFISAIPEPSTSLLGALGVLALLRRRR